LARAPRRRPLTARKKGSGYENVFPVNTSILFHLHQFIAQFISVYNVYKCKDN
jgi:hypothetical protein